MQMHCLPPIRLLSLMELIYNLRSSLLRITLHSSFFIKIVKLEWGDKDNENYVFQVYSWGCLVWSSVTSRGGGNACNIHYSPIERGTSE